MLHAADLPGRLFSLSSTVFRSLACLTHSNDVSQQKCAARAALPSSSQCTAPRTYHLLLQIVLPHAPASSFPCMSCRPRLRRSPPSHGYRAALPLPLYHASLRIVSASPCSFAYCAVCAATHSLSARARFASRTKALLCPCAHCST